MTIIDTHAHLYDLPDPIGVLKASRCVGVSDVVVLGVDLVSNQKHRDLKSIVHVDQECPRIHLALGLHPGNIHSIADSRECLAFIREHLAQAVAVGETGMDFWYKWVRNDDQKKQEQRDLFQQHLDLALNFSLPIVIHCRGAWRECFDMTRRSGIKKAVFHWYSGPVDVLKDILDAGFLVSVSPAIEYSFEVKRTAEYVPLSGLLVETDTPVAIVGSNGQRAPSGPYDVWRTLKALCRIKNVDELEALSILNRNAHSFFNITVL